jgi:hypothetical protein
MKMPWIDKTGLAKATSIFATGLVVSFGLCGVNFIFFLTAGDRAGIVPTYAGIIELVGLALCLIGLLTVGLIGIAQAIYRRFAGAPNLTKDK